jgi:hypothetical protein
MEKSKVLELLCDEPDELDIDEFIYKLWFRYMIDLALAEAEADDGMPHEEFVRLSDEWLA